MKQIARWKLFIIVGDFVKEKTWNNQTRTDEARVIAGNEEDMQA
jgi:hypothetical protein